MKTRPRRSRWLALAAVLGSGCGRAEVPPAAMAMVGWDPGPVPQAQAEGGRLFNSYCMSCHGLFGTGQGLGPPLVDTLYWPDHLADAAIARAITHGAPQRRWDFGAMPIVHRVGPAEVPEIIGYVRWLQQRAATTTSTDSGTP